MGKKRVASEKWIRLFIPHRRIPNESGVRIKVPVPLNDAYIALWPSYFVLFSCIPGADVWSRREDRALFDSMIQLCTCPERLFLGELSNGNMIRFEGLADSERIHLLCRLLYSTFGNPSIEEEGRALLALNPRVYVGDRELECLQTLSEGVSTRVTEEAGSL